LPPGDPRRLSPPPRRCLPDWLAPTARPTAPRTGLIAVLAVAGLTLWWVPLSASPATATATPTAITTASASAGAPIEITCSPVLPELKLGLQLNFVGGDCRPGGPFTPGNLVGFAFPFDNPTASGELTAVRLFFLNLQATAFNLYVWNDVAGLPDDTCGNERLKIIGAPILGDSVFTDIALDPPVAWAAGERIWIGAVYLETSVPPLWALGRVTGPSLAGRAFANFTGDHSDWFDLDDFNLGQCFAVRAVLDPDQNPNQPPVAVAGGPYCGAPLAPVVFDGTASSDADGDSLSYQWSFGDGTTATGPTPTHAYANPGTYPVILTVNDGVAAAADTARAFISNSVVVQVPGDMSLAEALAFAAGCDVDSIAVAPGTYTGPFVVSGTSVAIRATGGPAVTRLELTAGTGPVVSVLSGAPRLVGFTITGPAAGVRFTDGGTLNGCRIVQCGGNGVEIDSPSGVLVTQSVIAGNGALLPQSGGLAIRGNHQVTQSTVQGNRAFAISTAPWGVVSQSSISRSILTGSENGPGLICNPNAFPTVSCSDVWGNALGNALCGTDGGGNFSANPLFCDPVMLDLGLRQGSPCLNQLGCGLIGALPQSCGPALSRIEGLVTSAGGPLAGLQVRALHPQAGVPIASGITGHDGRFTIPGLGAGAYRVEVFTAGTFFVGEYYPDLPNYLPSNLPLATPVAVNGVNTVTGIDFTLALGGTFAGRVTDQITGLPLTGVPVHPFIFGGETLRPTVTATDGTFSTLPLLAGKYGGLVPERDGYFGEVYLERQHPADADTIHIFPGQRQLNITFTLLPGATGVPETPAPSPMQELTLESPVPNPFNPSTTIRFALAHDASHVTLDLYDVQGRRVRVLWDGPLSRGRHERTWDGRNAAGAPVATGIYFVRLQAGAEEQVRQAVLIR
jgi:PKD repeat protein